MFSLSKSSPVIFPGVPVLRSQKYDKYSDKPMDFKAQVRCFTGEELGVCFMVLGVSLANKKHNSLHLAPVPSTQETMKHHLGKELTNPVVMFCDVLMLKSTVTVSI